MDETSYKRLTKGTIYLICSKQLLVENTSFGITFTHQLAEFYPLLLY